MSHILDNPAWEALTTLQAHLAQGGAFARRYLDRLAPIAAVGRADAVALDELASLVPAGDWLSLPATVPGLVPLIRPPLKLAFTKTLIQMVWERARVPESPIPAPLSAADAPEMMELATLTRPGPFKLDTHTFGQFVGIRVDGRLAAMGGQRMHLAGYRELSGICTHPDFRGRGYARAIIERLNAVILDEGLTPFLHLEEANLSAKALYDSVGFVERARLPLVVIERVS